jgi:sulfopyruvate decarboxylase TPP-binding subunit
MPMFITMRGEWEEFNPWQVPMGQAVEPVLKLCDAEIMRVRKPDEVAGAAERALQSAYGDERIVAVLLSQELIGKKVWTK